MMRAMDAKRLGHHIPFHFVLMSGISSFTSDVLRSWAEGIPARYNESAISVCEISVAQSQVEQFSVLRAGQLYTERIAA